MSEPHRRRIGDVVLKVGGKDYMTSLRVEDAVWDK